MIVSNGWGMASKNTGSMAPGGTSSSSLSSASSASRVCGLGGSPRQTSAPVPIFVAEKLFDEFSLRRINAVPSGSRSSESNVSIGARTSDRVVGRSDHLPGFQPSAPPFECLGKSGVELHGFDDIFGGVPGVKSTSSQDEVFAMPKNQSPSKSDQRAGATESPRISSDSLDSLTNLSYQRVENQPQQRCPSHSGANQSPVNTGQPQNVSASNGHQSPRYNTSLNAHDSLNGSSSTPLPNLYSTRGRDVQPGGPHGASRLRNSGTEVKSGFPLDRQQLDSPVQQSRPVAPPYVVKASSPPSQEKSSNRFPVSGMPVASSSSQNSAPLSTQETSAAAEVVAPACSMPSCLPGVSNCSPRFKPKVGGQESKEEPSMKAESNKVTTSPQKSPEKRSESEQNHAGDKEKASVAEEVLLPRANGSWNEKKKLEKEAVSWGNRQQEVASEVVDASPRKSRKPSAAERLKAKWFPDFGKKEDKSKAKTSWFTVGDVKLVTQPTDVPPPNRAPPDMEHSGSRSVFKRGERWRRSSREEAADQPLPQVDRQALNHISSSTAAMKEAIERATAKIKQKQKSAEVFPERAEPDRRKRLVEEPLDGRGVDMDKRVVERTAHELKEIALKKAAERAAADAQRKAAAKAESMETRSTSAPKQRVSDDAERIAKKAFFSGEQCRPVAKIDPPKVSQVEPKPVRSEEEKRSRRNSTDKISEERAAKVLAEKNQRDLNAQQEQAERQRVYASVETRVKAWAAGKEGNLRALLVSLHEVLWSGSGWQPVSFSELSSEATIKKSYRRATLCVHPDKVQQRTVEERLVAEKVFDVLQGAWNKFNSQDAFFYQVA